MKYHWILLPIAITTVIAGCTIEQGDESVSEGDHNDFNELAELDWAEEVDGVGSITQSLPKGEGGKNGDKDYCDATHKCASGEGDCDGNVSCLAGLVCPNENGANFGFPTAWDVCVPAHCNNKSLDAGLGETTADCGGPCGTCPTALVDCTTSPPAGTASKEFCKTCLCDRGEGDCDRGTPAQCLPGLVCAEAAAVAPRWGYPTNWDVCLPPHCINNTQDSGETGVDVGGACSPGPLVPALNVYFTEYVEGSSNNHHLEIYNAGSAAQNCTVNVYYSGSASAGSTHTLNAAINPGELFVLCRADGDAGAMALCDQTSNLLQFNGDDAVELVCGAQTQDIVGQIGFDPGNGWGGVAENTYNRTLRRKCTVTTGDKVGSNAFVPSTEWDGFALNTFNNLGTNSCIP